MFYDGLTWEMLSLLTTMHGFPIKCSNEKGVFIKKKAKQRDCDTRVEIE